MSLSSSACRRRLSALGVSVEPALDAPASVAQPVRIAGPVAGVAIRLAGSKRPETDVHAVFDCRLVLALVPVARRLAAWGYDELSYVSATRRAGRKSQHRLGLAVDVVAVSRSGRRFSVAETYGKGAIDRCLRGRRPKDPFGRILCEAWRHRGFHTILGPEYDRAHHDHLHLDLAPHRKAPRTPYVGRGGRGVEHTPPRARGHRAP